MPSGDKNWWLEYCCKIIASTDKYLGWTNIGTCEEGRVIGNKIGGDNGCLFEPILLQLSDSSIKLAIDYFNRTGKKEIEVEIETIDKLHNQFSGANAQWNEKVIKLNPEGKVDITIHEEKLYSKEDILNLLNFVNDKLPDLYSRFSPEEEFNIWIKQNLK